jgi:hypothetical protein
MRTKAPTVQLFPLGPNGCDPFHSYCAPRPIWGRRLADARVERAQVLSLEERLRDRCARVVSCRSGLVGADVGRDQRELLRVRRGERAAQGGPRDEGALFGADAHRADLAQAHLGLHPVRRHRDAFVDEPAGQFGIRGGRLFGVAGGRDHLVGENGVPERAFRAEGNLVARAGQRRTGRGGTQLRRALGRRGAPAVPDVLPKTDLRGGVGVRIGRVQRAEREVLRAEAFLAQLRREHEHGVRRARVVFRQIESGQPA